jgi:hypothetical protein
MFPCLEINNVERKETSTGFTSSSGYIFLTTFLFYL